jgi:glycosyltransferase involved in cell wall biosynthesis
MRGYSIIVCTHNPDPALFSAVTENVLNIAKKSSRDTEVLIIDNKSWKPLSEDHELNKKFKGIVDYSIIREEKQGLTYARITGFLNARYDWLVFVDDDNLPAENYIEELQRLEQTIPEVKCWGAGKIEVEYTDQKETSYLKSVKNLFQERDFAGVNYSCNKKGGEYYPTGSCICVHKIVFKKYYELFTGGAITSGDRTGNSLSSAGDAQIVYVSVKNKYPVGSSGNLQIKHFINKNKTKNSYLLRLVYALNSCHIKAYNEVFPDDPIPVKPSSAKEICKGLYTHFRIKGFFPVKKNLLDIARLMGIYNARHLAGNFRKPFILTMFERIIGHK